MHELQDPVVASLANRTAHPYSSVAMSSNRRHAIVAGKGKVSRSKNICSAVARVGLSTFVFLLLTYQRYVAVDGSESEGPFSDSVAPNFSGTKKMACFSVNYV